jgi:toxin-antitoxin system PIN domain toxin
MLIDANMLLYSVDDLAPEHDRAAAWLTEQLNGDRRIGIPWESLTAFVRIATNPRATTRPLPSVQAWRFVEDWLAADPVWIPVPTDRHVDVLGSLIRTHRIGGNLISDAHLAALAIEHGLEVCSADTDFARFPEVRWRDPLLE